MGLPILETLSFVCSPLLDSQFVSRDIGRGVFPNPPPPPEPAQPLPSFGPLVVAAEFKLQYAQVATSA